VIYFQTCGEGYESGEDEVVGLSPEHMESSADTTLSAIDDYAALSSVSTSSPCASVLSAEDEQELLQIISQLPASPSSNHDPGYETASLGSPCSQVDDLDFLSELFPDLL
jgi:hypothetical protein